MSAHHTLEIPSPIPDDIAFARCLSPTSSLQACFVRSRQTSVTSLDDGDSASATAFQYNELDDTTPYESNSLRLGHLNFQLLTPATFGVAATPTQGTWKRRLKRTISMLLSTTPTLQSTTAPTPPAPPPTRTPSLQSSTQTRSQSLFRKRYDSDALGPVSFTAPWLAAHNEPGRRSLVRQSKSLAGLSQYFDDSASEDLDPATLEALGVAQVQNI